MSYCNPDKYNAYFRSLAAVLTGTPISGWILAAGDLLKGRISSNKDMYRTFLLPARFQALPCQSVNTFLQWNQGSLMQMQFVYQIHLAYCGIKRLKVHGVMRQWPRSSAFPVHNAPILDSM